MNPSHVSLEVNPNKTLCPRPKAETRLRFPLSRGSGKCRWVMITGATRLWQGIEDTVFHKSTLLCLGSVITPNKASTPSRVAQHRKYVACCSSVIPRPSLGTGWRVMLLGCPCSARLLPCLTPAPQSVHLLISGQYYNPKIEGVTGCPEKAQVGLHW